MGGRGPSSARGRTARGLSGGGVAQHKVFVGLKPFRAGRGGALPRGVERVDPRLVDRDLAVALVELLDVHAVALVILRPPPVFPPPASGRCTSTPSGRCARACSGPS